MRRPGDYDEQIKSMRTIRRGDAATLVTDDAAPCRFTRLSPDEGRRLDATLRSVMRGDWNRLLGSGIFAARWHLSDAPTDLREAVISRE